MGTNYFRRDPRDTKFLLFEHLGMDKLLSYEDYKDFSADDFKMIVDEALKVSVEVLGPAMQDGDLLAGPCRERLDGHLFKPRVWRTGPPCDCWRVSQ
jgi:hypothetical protein